MVDCDTKRVLLTGIGCVSPLGRDMEELAAALRKGRPAIRRITLFAPDRYRCQTAGEVPDEWLDAAHPHAGSIRPTRMIYQALTEAITGMPGLAPSAVIIGTTSGGMPCGEEFYRKLAAGAPLERGLVRDYLPIQPVVEATRAAGIEVPITIVSTACASGTDAIGQAYQMIKAGRAQQVLAGGYDAIAELVHAGFDALQASTEAECRPFDRHRSGLVLGEGAAMLLLESEQSAAENGRTPIAEIAGFGSAPDNHHLTQPNPDGSGPLRAMQRALDAAGIRPEQVEYINAHGTGTIFNDASEGAAVGLLNPEAPVSSTKGFMGHSLGAAGAIEAAICIAGLRGDFLPGNIGVEEPDPALDINLICSTIANRRSDIMLSNSFGFGGSNASIAIRRWSA